MQPQDNQNHATFRDKKNQATSQDKKIMQLFQQKNYATSKDKNITQPFGPPKGYKWSKNLQVSVK